MEAPYWLPSRRRSGAEQRAPIGGSKGRGGVGRSHWLRKARRIGAMAAAVLSRCGGGGAVLSALLSARQPYSSVFRAAELRVEQSPHPKPKPPPEHLKFGQAFTDHMLTIEWSRVGGWGPPHIRPFQDLSLHPASSALHYAVELFEGMKAFRGADDKIRLFRPELNMERMGRSAQRVCLPPFDPMELLECIRALVRLEQDWVPRSEAASLYIRPTYIGTEELWPHHCTAAAGAGAGLPAGAVAARPPTAADRGGHHEPLHLLAPRGWGAGAGDPPAGWAHSARSNTAEPPGDGTGVVVPHPHNGEWPRIGPALPESTERHSVRPHSQQLGPATVTPPAAMGYSGGICPLPPPSNAPKTPWDLGTGGGEANTPPPTEPNMEGGADVPLPNIMGGGTICSPPPSIPNTCRGRGIGNSSLQHSKILLNGDRNSAPQHSKYPCGGRGQKFPPQHSKISPWGEHPPPQKHSNCPPPGG
uniref:branched-chain-amino-acid transaminase n=1 Tax=Pavo cristatus TaxID=9049 RepID=A0A8C9LAF3_PAVCR